MIVKSNYLFFTTVALLVLSLFFSACRPTKFLDIGESLLVKNEVELESDESKKIQRKLKEDLATINKQKPNRRFLNINRAWYYYKTEGDSSRIKKFIYRKIAENPSIFLEENASKADSTIKYFLQNKGYYDADASHTTKNRWWNSKKTKVIYTGITGSPYVVDSVFFSSSDPNISLLLKDIQQNTFIKKGKPISLEMYTKETNRITQYLRNKGYAYFDRNYIDELYLDVDKHVAKVYLKILKDEDGSNHQKYQIGKITINPLYGQDAFQEDLKDSLYNGLHFKMTDGPMLVKYNIIAPLIFLRQNDLYKQKNLDKTKKQLNNLGVYRVININAEKDENNPSLLNYEILLAPKKRMTFGADLEFNNSNYNSTDSRSSLIGTGISLSFSNRNFRKNATLFLMEIQTGVELNFGNINKPDAPVLYSNDFNFQTSLFFPKFVDYSRVWRLAHKLNLLTDNFYNDLKETAKTKLSVELNLLSLSDYYAYNSFNASLGYQLSKGKNRYSINTLGVNYLLPLPKEAFQVTLDTIPFLAKSFTRHLMTGFIFKDLTYEFTNKQNLKNDSWFFRGALDFSGLEVLGINSIYNAIAKEKTTFKLFKNDANLITEYSQFARLELDLRYNFKLNPKNAFAFRFASSIASPFGGFSRDIPYAKQFYVGGPTSLRAWRIRELGPGSFHDSSLDDPDNTQPFYQAGDLKMELNAEYRFDLFWYLEGALFIDIGNIWTVKKDTSRLGSQFLFKEKSVSNENETIINENFLKQLAIGSGFGIRADFEYFIISFDVGVKMRYPYLNPDPDAVNKNYWFHKTIAQHPLREILNYNLGIGYPF